MRGFPATGKITALFQAVLYDFDIDGDTLKREHKE